jgi:hypothetical protein
MTFCNAFRKVSNWNAVGITLADMFLLLWWTMHFFEMVRVVRAARFQRSALYLGMDSNISHSNECIIPILILCDISTSIVPLFTLQSYIQFILQMAIISIWMPSLPTHHWLCVITSRTSLQHVSTAPTKTWYHYLLVLLPSMSCCHHGKREVPWLWQVVHSDWTTPDVPQSLLVSDGGTHPPAETHCRMPQQQQWDGPLNRNNSCCFRPWGWWWYVYQRCQETTTHW